MKVKSFPVPRIIMATVAQGRTVLCGFWFLFRTNLLFALVIFLFAVVAGLSTMPHDSFLLDKLHFWRGEQETVARRISYFLGTMGDYPTYNLPLAVLIWIYGAWTKSSAWRRVAVICFLGASLAGLFDDCFRLTLGRPRPDAQVPDGFYGIAYTFQGKFQSFPSGHAAAVFGTAFSLLVTNRRLGIITGLYALAVVWARMELNRHYPSDVIVGSIVGVYFGLMIGYGAKVRRPKTKGAK